MNIVVKENEIVFNNQSISFKYPIKAVEKLGDRYFILLKIPSRIELGEEELNNILCYDINGNHLWRISDKLPDVIQSKTQMPYVAIQIHEDSLKAIDFIGRKFNVDVYTGNLSDLQIIR